MIISGEMKEKFPLFRSLCFYAQNLDLWLWKLYCKMNAYAPPGFCRLVPHPRSPGTWTVHFEGADCDSHFSAADNTEMVGH